MLLWFSIYEKGARKMIHKRTKFMKPVYLTVLSASLIATLGTTHAAKAVAAQSNTYSAQLIINSKETDVYLQSNTFKEGNKYYLGDELKNAKKSDGDIKLKFSITDIDEDKVRIVGDGKIKVKGLEKYKFNMDDSLQKYQVNGREVYFGPVITEAKKQKDDQTDTALGIFVDSQTKEVFVTESIGTLQNDNGVGMLVFGDIPTSYLELKNKFLSSTPNPSETNEGTNIAENLFGVPTANADVEYSASTKFNYKTSLMTQAIGKTGNSTGTPSTFPSVSYATLGINIYSREAALAGNGQGMVAVRAWSNTPIVEEYMKGTESDPYGTTNFRAGIYSFVIGAGNSNLLLDAQLDKSSPMDSKPVKAIKLPIVKGYVKASFDLLATVWAQYQNATLPVKTTTTNSTVVNTWKAYAEKTISAGSDGAIDKKADLPSKTAGVTSQADTDGGFMSYFYFDEQVDGAQKMFVKAKAVYLGSSNLSPALGFFVTPKIETSYSHQF